MCIFNIYKYKFFYKIPIIFNMEMYKIQNSIKIEKFLKCHYLIPKIIFINIYSNKL